MRKKGIIYIWWQYLIARFGNSIDRKMPVQEAVASRKLDALPELRQLSEADLQNLVMDIRGAARDYYFKGNVPDYYRPVLQKYRRSVLYHILFQRNFA